MHQLFQWKCSLSSGLIGSSEKRDLMLGAALLDEIVCIFQINAN